MSEASQVTAASPEEVWRHYERVADWPAWDGSLERSELVGNFTVGSRGRVKPRGGPSSAFVLSGVEPNSRFSVRTRLLFTEVLFEHELEASREGTRITHRVHMSGALAPLVRRLLGPTLARSLPLAVAALARMAVDPAS